MRLLDKGVKGVARVDVARMWKAHRAELFGFVVKRVHDPALAEDIVHDVFTKVLERRESLRDSSKLRAWLYQITRNSIADHYRRLRPRVSLPDDLREAETDSSRLAERELAECMMPLIERLPPPYRRALMLAEIQGVVQSEIAAREGLSVAGAKARVQRGRRLLRDRILSCCRVELDGGRIMDYKRRGECGC